MMFSPNRLRFKIFTSFAIAALGVIGLARLTAIAPLSGTTALAYLGLGVFVIAGLWRGLLYLRAARGAVRP